MLHRFSKQFYFSQFCILAILAIFFTMLSRNEWLDWYISDLWFDAGTQQFPLKDNFWLAVFSHQYVKHALIAVALAQFVLGGILKRYEWMAIAIIMLLGPAMVSVLKSFSMHSCPWDLVRYGGDAYSYPLFSPTDQNLGQGGCFPGGHASGGYGVMAYFLLLYPVSKPLARWALVLGIALGMLMGFGQVMRGAHFFTHNLWSGWWVWLTQMTLYYLYTVHIKGIFARSIGTNINGRKRNN